MSRPPYIDIDIDGASLRFHLCENDYICRIEYGLIAQLKDAQMLASDPSGLRRKTPPVYGAGD